MRDFREISFLRSFSRKYMFFRMFSRKQVKGRSTHKIKLFSRKTQKESGDFHEYLNFRVKSPREVRLRKRTQDILGFDHKTSASLSKKTKSNLLLYLLQLVLRNDIMMNQNIKSP